MNAIHLPIPGVRMNNRSVSRRTVLRSAAGLGAAATLPVFTGRAEAVVPRPGRDVFVDPVHGDDALDGRSRRAGGPGHGPVRTLEKALQRAYAAADTVTIWLAGGTYARRGPLVIGPHGGAVRLAAYPGERPLVSGAEQITGWAPTTVNGVRAWKTAVPASWTFRQLYVNGERRTRPRLPAAASAVLDQGHPVDDVNRYFYPVVATPASSDGRTFGYAGTDIDPGWHNLHDVDVISIRDWFDERAPIESVDSAARTCTLAFRPYAGKAWPDLFYYVENVFEALRLPGQWYRDSVTNEVYYIPRAGEQIDAVSISAPRTAELLRLEGSAGNPVRDVEIDGVTFAHSTWKYYTHISQSASQAGGAVVIENAQDCALRNCTVRTVGEYGISVNASSAVQIVGCEITDTGAGGIKVGSSSDAVPNGEHTITDNHIHHAGRVFHMGAGILAMDTYGNQLAHNHIHDLFYTGISAGWNWGFAATHAHDNTIEQNHIHDLSRGLLSDLGAIYTLDIQTGTVVRNNLLHDVTGYTGAPAAGLYADEGSSHIIWENNLVHSTTPGFNLNYGADNTVRNNVIAHAGHAAVSAGNDNRGGVSPYSCFSPATSWSSTTHPFSWVSPRAAIRPYAATTICCGTRREISAMSICPPRRCSRSSAPTPNRTCRAPAPRSCWPTPRPARSSSAIWRRR